MFSTVNGKTVEKLEAVENICETGAVKIGIGSTAQEPALRQAGCTKVFTLEHLEWSQGSDRLRTKIDFDAFIRAEDTIVMVQPGYLPVKMMRQIAAVGCQFQVPGHDPVRFASDDDRAAWRRQKPKGDTPLAAEAGGRPPKYPVPTPEQASAFLSDWNSPLKRGLVDQRHRERMGLAPDDTNALPSHHMRDLAIKLQGTAKRNKR